MERGVDVMLSAIAMVEDYKTALAFVSSLSVNQTYIIQRTAILHPSVEKAGFYKMKNSVNNTHLACLRFRDGELLTWPVFFGSDEKPVVDFELTDEEVEDGVIKTRSENMFDIISRHFSPNDKEDEEIKWFDTINALEISDEEREVYIDLHCSGMSVSGISELSIKLTRMKHPLAKYVFEKLKTVMQNLK